MESSLYALIGKHDLVKELSKIDQQLLNSLDDRSEITKVVDYFIKTKSKRLRSALMIELILSNKKKLSNLDIKAIAAVEMLHLATLVHDDIIDQSNLRHSKITINKKHSDFIAIVAGDYLMNKSFMLASSCSNKTRQLLNKAFEDICEGQYLELKNNFNKQISIPDYFKIIKGKTASLFSYALSIAGYQSNLNTNQIDQVFKFGLNFGIAFQIMDDLVDIYSTEKLANKKIHQDFDSGVYTLPILLANKLKIIDILKAKNFDSIKSKLRKSDIFYETEKILLNYITEATNSINLPLRQFPVLYLEWSKKQFFKDSIK